MSLMATAKQTIDPAPIGNHIARCISVIDLGTQSYEYGGKTNTSRKIRISWELPNEQKIFKEENGMQPYVLSKEYSLTLSKKSKLRNDLESWRGKPFTEIELKGFDILNLLGKCCLLNVIHNEKEYAEITAITPIPKGTNVPEKINDLIKFVISEFDEKVFNGLPEFLKTKIIASPEYNALKNPDQLHTENDEGEYIEDMIF